MVAFYNYHFQIGHNIHKVEIYEKYTPELGVSGLITTISNTVYKNIEKEIKPYLSKIQLKTLKKSSKEKISGIIDENGEYQNL